MATTPLIMHKDLDEMTNVADQNLSKQLEASNAADDHAADDHCDDT